MAKQYYTPLEVARRVRAEGYTVGANVAEAVARELHLGRIMRAPHYGLVLSESEAIDLAQTLREGGELPGTSKRKVF